MFLISGTKLCQGYKEKRLYSIFSFLISNSSPKPNKALKRKKGHAMGKRGSEEAESPPSPKAPSADRSRPPSFDKAQYRGNPIRTKEPKPLIGPIVRFGPAFDAIKEWPIRFLFPKSPGYSLLLYGEPTHCISKKMSTGQPVPHNMRLRVSGLPPSYKRSIINKNHNPKFLRDLRKDRSITAGGDMDFSVV